MGSAKKWQTSKITLMGLNSKAPEPSQAAPPRGFYYFGINFYMAVKTAIFASYFCFHGTFPYAESEGCEAGDR
jgi:hypothetical protein